MEIFKILLFSLVIIVLFIIILVIYRHNHPRAHPHHQSPKYKRVKINVRYFPSSDSTILNTTDEDDPTPEQTGGMSFGNLDDAKNSCAVTDDCDAVISNNGRYETVKLSSSTHAVSGFTGSVINIKKDVVKSNIPGETVRGAPIYSNMLIGVPITGQIYRKHKQDTTMDQTKNREDTAFPSYTEDTNLLYGYSGTAVDSNSVPSGTSTDHIYMNRAMMIRGGYFSSFNEAYLIARDLFFKSRKTTVNTDGSLSKGFDRLIIAYNPYSEKIEIPGVYDFAVAEPVLFIPPGSYTIRTYADVEYSKVGSMTISPDKTTKKIINRESTGRCWASYGTHSGTYIEPLYTFENNKINIKYPPRTNGVIKSNDTKIESNAIMNAHILWTAKTGNQAGEAWRPTNIMKTTIASLNSRGVTDCFVIPNDAPRAPKPGFPYSVFVTDIMDIFAIDEINTEGNKLINTDMEYYYYNDFTADPTKAYASRENAEKACISDMEYENSTITDDPIYKNSIFVANENAQNICFGTTMYGNNYHYRPAITSEMVAPEIPEEGFTFKSLRTSMIAKKYYIEYPMVKYTDRSQFIDFVKATKSGDQAAVIDGNQEGDRILLNIYIGGNLTGMTSNVTDTSVTPNKTYPKTTIGVSAVTKSKVIIYKSGNKFNYVKTIEDALKIAKYIPTIKAIIMEGSSFYFLKSYNPEYVVSTAIPECSVLVVEEGDVLITNAAYSVLSPLQNMATSQTSTQSYSSVGMTLSGYIQSGSTPYTTNYKNIYIDNILKFENFTPIYKNIDDAKRECNKIPMCSGIRKQGTAENQRFILNTGDKYRLIKDDATTTYNATVTTADDYTTLFKYNTPSLNNLFGKTNIDPNINVYGNAHASRYIKST